MEAGRGGECAELFKAGVAQIAGQAEAGRSRAARQGEGLNPEAAVEQGGARGVDGEELDAQHRAIQGRQQELRGLRSSVRSAVEGQRNKGDAAVAEADSHVVGTAAVGSKIDLLQSELCSGALAQSQQGLQQQLQVCGAHLQGATVRLQTGSAQSVTAELLAAVAGDQQIRT